MAVRCSHCGEELLGAVNRCWKCGRAFAAQPTLDGLPPVRRVPLAEASPIQASPDPSAMAAAPADLVDVELATDAPKIRTGSPFSAASPPVPVGGSTRPLAPLPPQTISTPLLPNHVAVGGAIGAIVLGIFALALAPFRAEAAVVAMIGMAMGIWGLYSPKRTWAFVGLLICCLAIGLASYTGAKLVNAVLNRNKAWETDAVEFEDVTQP